MTNNKIQIDVGRGILTVESYDARGTNIVTAYVDGISIRCGSTHLSRVAEAFVDTVLTACQIDEGASFDETVDYVEQELFKFIASSKQAPTLPNNSQ